MSQPNFTVIIPTFNRVKTLKRTLEHIFNQTFPGKRYEVIVVDDGSGDDTASYLASIRPPIHFRYIINKHNVGRAATRNSGVRIARGKYLLFIDDDIWTDKFIIEKHYHTLASAKDNIVSVGAILNSPEVPKTAINLFLNKHHLWCFNEMKKHEAGLPFFFCKTANLALPATLLHKTGLFDETFIHYGGEDTELGIRLKKRKIKMIFTASAIGYHYHNESIELFAKKEIERAHSIANFNRIHVQESEKEYISFFIPEYNQAKSIKAVGYNIVKYFIFSNLCRQLTRIFVKITNDRPSLMTILVKLAIPLLRIQYQRYGYLQISSSLKTRRSKVN